MKKLLWTAILSCFIVGFAFAGGGGQQQNAQRSGSGKTPVTFTLMMYPWTTWDEPMSADPVGRWITEQTGVTLDVEIATGDLEEKYSLMLASGDYPDFLVYQGNLHEQVIARYIEEGALVDLGAYLDRMPNVVSKYGTENLNAMRDLNDDKLYHLTQWSMMGQFIPSLGINIRADVMRDYFGARADQKNTFTVAEITDMFRKYKTAHPVSAWGGTPVYPLTGRTTLEENSMYEIAGQMFGITPYYETDSTRVLPDYMHPEYINMLKWFNLLYREGLLDPEFAINKAEDMQTKLANGSAIAAFAHAANVSQASAAVEQRDPRAYIQSYYRVADVPGKETYIGMSTVGSGGLVVTRNCKNLDRALAFIDFMSEPLTSFVLANGLEGGIWNYDAGGKVVMNQAAIDATPELWARFRKYGAYKYMFMMNEGRDNRFPAYDGFLYQPIHNMYGQWPKEQVARNTYWNKEDLVTQTFFLNLDPPAGTPEAVSQQRITDLLDQTLPRIIMAPSEAEAQRLYNDMITQIRGLGFDQLMAGISQRYFKQKAILNSK
jgi:putative aldouronate transport system substrate-binding protein